ncbi:MAG: alpha/beta hydrolase [Verrucomicrobiales bacterium]
MKISLLVPLLVLPLVGGALAGGSQAGGIQVTTETRLAGWLQKYPEADANGDGMLTVGEARAFRAKMLAEPGVDQADRSARTKPTHANVVYGSHERNRFDVWIPDESTDGLLSPVVIYFHGGGFVAGDKTSFDPTPYLDAGIACVSANYRFVNGHDLLSDAPFRDAARVVQTVRKRCSEWNLDPGRVALSGGSAGAVMALWTGLHDDLANPDSDDPVSQESTRVTCVVPVNGPTNLLPDWILENIGGAAHVHASFAMMFGQTIEEALTPAVRARIMAVSPWEHVSEDDPPVFLIYSGPLDEVPLPASARTGKVIHHPFFGKALKEKLDAAGVEADFKHGFNPRGRTDIVDYLKNKFAMVD